MSINRDWVPGFGEIVTWFAMDKAGASGSVYDILRDRRMNHRSEVFAGVLEAECALLLTHFFEDPARRAIR